MSKRQRAEDLEFGSDSFLDIVANMVGILIILIVVAGMRVSQSSIEPPAEPEEVGELVDELPYYGDSAAPVWQDALPLIAETEPVVPPPIVIDLTPEDRPELRERYRQQLAALQKLRETTGRLTTVVTTAQESQRLAALKVGVAESDHNKLDLKIDSLRQQYNASKDELAATLARKAASEKLLSQGRQQVDAVKQSLAATPAIEQTGKVLQHDLTPVSELIQGKELHFHISNGRIALVPIETMMTRIRSQIEGKKDWLLKSNAVHGEIGPVDGFRMRYLIQRENLTPLEELRMGAGMVRIGLREWTIEPDATLVAETVEQASQPTSRFELALRSASLDTTCTLWVYSDSFDEFQEFQKLIRKYNLRVAGRPLPDGVPITGSPNGSRSAAQ